MAGNQIKMSLTLEDGGSIKKKTADTKELNGELTKTSKLAGQALDVKPAASRAKAKSAAYAAANVSEDIEYNRGRGASGATGAAARDFADQSRGLGGLVRLYATYAANLFAVTAAFNALRDAMNTTNMVEGLNQLGAASGVALGGLAKQFTQASGGAISLRESMEATTKAISSGLSQQQFLDLGKVAKNASQALGVNMSDAVSRLTRGITKLEPELLDELGIFTRVGKATEDYAKSVGKSVNSLTDFERRQAFANAVLEEGKQKFGEIALETNPYDQLLANLKDVAQTILETVNTVVAPVAKLLADNVGLIGLAIAAAALKITQQALPALASWQKGLKDAAEDAKNRASEIYTSFGEAFVEREEARANVPKYQAEAVKLTAQEVVLKKQIASLAKEAANSNLGYTKDAKTLATLRNKEVLSTEQLNKLNIELNKKRSSDTDAAKRQVSIIQQRIALEQQLVALGDRQKTNAANLTDAYNKVQSAADIKPRVLSEDWQREQIVRQEAARSARLSLLSSVSERIEKGGLVGGLKGFYSETAANQDLSRFGKLRTVATGSLLGVAKAAGILGSALASAFNWLQVGILAFTLLDLAFSKNSKQVSEFTTAIDVNADSVKTAANTAERYKNILSVDSINAQANAFVGLTDAAKGLIDTFRQADASASWFDSLIDKVKSVFGADLSGKFVDNFSQNIVFAIQQIPEGDAKAELQKKVLSITGATELSIKGLDKSIGSLSKQEIFNKSKQLVNLITVAGQSLKDAQAYTQDIAANEKSLQETLSATARSLSQLTDYDKSVQQIAKNISGLEKSFNSPIAAANTFNGILSGDINISILGISSALQSLQNANAFKMLSSQANNLKVQLDAIKQAQKDLNNIQQPKKVINVQSGLRAAAIQRANIPEQYAALEARKQALTPQLESVNIKIAEIFKNQQQVLQQAQETIINKTIAAFEAKLGKIGIQGQLSALSRLPVETEQNIRERGKLEQDLINAEYAQTSATLSLVLELQKTQLVIQQQNRSNLEAEALKARLRGEEDTSNRIQRQLATMPGQQQLTDALESLSGKGNLRLAMKSGLVSDNALQAMQGLQLAGAQRAASLQNVRASTEQDVLRLGKSNALKDLDAQIKTVDNSMVTMRKVLEDSTLSIEKRTQTETELKAAIAARSSLEEQKIKTGQEFDNKIAMAAGASKDSTASTIVEIGKNAQQALAETTQAAATSSAASTQDVINSVNEINKQYKEKYNVQEQLNQLNLQSLSIQEQELNKARELGVLGDTEYETAISRIANERTSIELSSRLSELNREKENALKALTDLESKLTANQTKEKDILETLKTQVVAYYDNATAGAIKLADAQTRANIPLTDAQKRMQNFNEFGKNLFEGFGDAIMDFAQTGKWSFGDMVKSMIADLLRLEMRMQMMRAYQNSGGLSGIVNSIAGAFTGGSGYTGTGIDPTTLTGADITAAFTNKSAKGNAFDSGVMRFAKGGSFLNSVVNTPTPFKFASGTGLMGEAGPEAIMPLQRDSHGNLGVRAQGGGSNTTVTVNNYGSEKAEVKETVDSRGDRNIEVIIGDMVAGQVSKTSSATNSSIRNSFGLKPQLVRR